MYEGFIDLDELILLCRNKQAKQFIKEAVKCYRAGAFRSCIIATWNAVVFDFLHKLREIELFGNGEATAQLEHFEHYRSQEDFKGLWQFESQITQIALEEFELISGIEKNDLDRLFKDRSRCAHPSMTSLEEPFEATAELARYHLRSAITHFLQHPPVQGRKAQERIWNDIKSDYFPKNSREAVEYFKHSPLANPKKNLLKNIIKGITIDLLKEDRSEDERARQFAALKAIEELHHSQTREILNESLSDIIINKVSDDNLYKVVLYLGILSTWDELNNPCQLRVKNFMQNEIDKYLRREGKQPKLSPDQINLLSKASNITFIKNIVQKKYMKFSFRDLLEIHKNNQSNNIKNHSIEYSMMSKINESNLLLVLLNFYTKLQYYISDNETEGLLNVDDKLRKTIEEKINNSDLKELLRLSKYLSLYCPIKETERWFKEFYDDDNPKEDYFKEINDAIFKKIDNMNISEISKLQNSWSIREFNFILYCRINNATEPSNELLDLIVDKFINSKSYDQTINDGNLLLKVAKNFNINQWKKILNAYIENDQILRCQFSIDYYLNLCDQSAETNDGMLPSCWFDFRKKIEGINYDYDAIKPEKIKKLKDKIDSYHKKKLKNSKS